MLPAGCERVERLAVDEVKLDAVIHPRVVLALALLRRLSRIPIIFNRGVNDPLPNLIHIPLHLRVFDDGRIKRGMNLIRLPDDLLIRRLKKAAAGGGEEEGE